MKLNNLLMQLCYLHTHMSMGDIDKYLIMGIHYDQVKIRFMPFIWADRFKNSRHYEIKYFY